MVNPWYREPWAWFLLIPILTSITVGMFMLRMAITTADGLVSDDYYKEGRAYNQTRERDELAAALNAQAIIRFDEITGDIGVRIQGDFERLPNDLVLEVVHPTREGFDQTLQLAATLAPEYNASIESLMPGPRLLELHSPSQGWRLRARTLWPDQDVTYLRSLDGL